MAGRGAGQTDAQMPQPVQALALIEGRPWVRVTAPATGQRSEQVMHTLPWWARQSKFSIRAVPMVGTGASDPRTSTRGLQAVMQGVSGQLKQGLLRASIIGVPAAPRRRAGAGMIA